MPKDPIFVDAVMTGLIAALAGALLALGWLAVCLRRARRGGGAIEEIERLHDRIWRVSESEERYRVLVTATTDAVVERDGRDRILFADTGYAQLLGRAPLDLVGAEAELEMLEQGPVEVGPDGVRRVEVQIRTSDGHTRWFAFVEVPMTGADGSMHWLRAGRDVTARVAAIRALDAALGRAEAGNVAKSRFLATVSHEMRTPLNGILGMAELVLGTGLDPEQRTYVEAVRTSGQALLGLIDGILDFSRIEAGRLDLVAEPFDPAALAQGVVELLAPRAQDAGLEIALDVAADVPDRVVGDADRVRQILLNLAGNAIKFTERGGVGVTVTRCAEGGLVLAVTDTGPGIPEERLPVLFEEFEQGDGGPARHHAGTGLGLAITRRLAERMGGQVDARSRVGHGSTFSAVLPLPPAPGVDPVEAPYPQLDGRRCLIVADSPFQAPYLARGLSRAGAAAVIVPGLEEGLDALSGAAFDVVIADRSLGDHAVRTLADAARGCGVGRSLVLLSPFDRREFGAPAASGFDGYLIKPVRTRSLFERLVSQEPAAASAPPPEPVPAPTSRGLRVLLAEDNPINALLATRVLERLGCTVVHAADGVEALERYDMDGPFDLGLIDVRMPRLDGHETARRIRAAEAGGAARLRLVALTANVGRADELAAEAAGFDEFLAKPLHPRVLAEAVAGSGRRAAA